MNPSAHILEHDLIAYQLGEPSDAQSIAHHLETCPACARLAESIAETLRVFSAESVPQSNLDHAWQRLRGNLPALAGPSRRPLAQAWKWLTIPLAAALSLAAAFLLAGYVTVHHRAAPSFPLAHMGPGPLSDQPKDPELAAHLENAERLLTEINHSDGPLDQATRGQAHVLLLSNALYVRQARADGDPAEVSVLENLDRTLTTLEHEQPFRPQETARSETDPGWHLQVSLNTQGLLLDLRILQQNSQQQTSDQAAHDRQHKGIQ